MRHDYLLDALIPDGATHLLAYGTGVFGFEGLPANLGISNNDFNDAVFAFNFTAMRISCGRM